MRYARIINGIVTNVELWGSEPAAEGVTFVQLAADSPVGIGHTYANGVFTAPAPLPPVVPESVRQDQLRLALLQLHGADSARLTTAIDAAVLALPVQDQESARLRWTYAERPERTSSIVVAVCGELGLSSSQIDAVFILAATL